MMFEVINLSKEKTILTVQQMKKNQPLTAMKRLISMPFSMRAFF